MSTVNSIMSVTCGCMHVTVRHYISEPWPREHSNDSIDHATLLLQELLPTKLQYPTMNAVASCITICVECGVEEPWQALSILARRNHFSAFHLQTCSQLLILNINTLAEKLHMHHAVVLYLNEEAKGVGHLCSNSMPT